MRPWLALLALSACSPRVSIVELPVEPQHRSGLLVLGEEVHALRFADGELVGDPPRTDREALASDVFLYLYERPLEELGLQAGLQELPVDGTRLVPTPDASFGTPAEPVAWAPLASRWQGPITGLRVEGPTGCVVGPAKRQTLTTTNDPPIFAVALGPEGGWEETAVLVGLESGALFLVTPETFRPVDQPQASVDACGDICRIGPVFRGFGDEIWFTYRDTGSIAFHGAVRRAPLDLDAARFELAEEVLRSDLDYPALALVGPLRTPVDRIDAFEAKHKPDRRQVLGQVTRYALGDVVTVVDRPLAFETDTNDPKRYSKGDLAYVSPEHIAALWPFEPVDNVGYTAYALQERTTTSSIAQLAYVPEIGLVLGDEGGGLWRHPTALGDLPEPLPAQLSSAVLALESTLGGFVAVERGALHQYRGAAATACAPVALLAESSAFVTHVGDELVVVSAAAEGAVVEWLTEREAP